MANTNNGGKAYIPFEEIRDTSPLSLKKLNDTIRHIINKVQGNLDSKDIVDLTANKVIVNDLYSLSADDGYTKMNASGLHVYDDSEVERVTTGWWMDGSIKRFGHKVKTVNGSTVLDDRGIIQSWGDSVADNVDSTHKLKMKFHIPSETLNVVKVILNFSIEPFRAYETGAVAGGGSVTTSSSGGSGTFTSTEATGLGYGGSTASAGGSHPHEIIDPNYTEWTDITHSHNFSFTLSEHDHDVVLPSHDHSVSFPSHEHGINYGIFEDTSAADCKVYVDGVLRLDNGGAGYNTDQANLDLTEWITTSGWHTIELSSTRLGRFNAAYFIQVFLGV